MIERVVKFSFRCLWGSWVDWHSAQSAPGPGTFPALSTNAYSLNLIRINQSVGALANTASIGAVTNVRLVTTIAFVPG